MVSVDPDPETDLRALCRVTRGCLLLDIKVEIPADQCVMRPLRQQKTRSFPASMKTIDEHIQKDQEEFLKALAEHNDGKVRHLTEELQWLLDHKKQFPDDTHDPSPLELFCEQNPDEPECLVYDD